MAHERVVPQLKFSIFNFQIQNTMRNMKMTCANVADDSGLILGTSGYGYHGICGRYR